jgi:FeS assembly SUF system protein
MAENINRSMSNLPSDVQSTAQPVADTIKQEIIAALRNVYDPEISVNIYDLGLIYEIDIDDAGQVQIQMTLTAAGCPVAGFIVQQVESAANSVSGVNGTNVELVWDPPWSQDMMSEEAKLELGLY